MPAETGTVAGCPLVKYGQELVKIWFNTTIASRMVAWELSHESTVQHREDVAVPVMKSESPAFWGLSYASASSTSRSSGNHHPAA
jgi:hypothetical protein